MSRLLKCEGGLFTKTTFCMIKLCELNKVGISVEIIDCLGLEQEEGLEWRLSSTNFTFKVI